MTDNNVKREILHFHKSMTNTSRDASFDFCYLYFHTKKGKLANDMENCCMHLWSYLASWGMLRNSPLQSLSPASLKPLIAHFDDISHSNIWNIDVDSYPQEKYCIIDEYKKIESILKQIMGKAPTVTLVTKIMLGIFGCVPAFDRYFTQTFNQLYNGFYQCRDIELDYIYDFYTQHKVLLDDLSTNMYVINFEGKPTSFTYKKAKLIDMFGFTKAMNIKY